MFMVCTARPWASRRVDKVAHRALEGFVFDELLLDLRVVLQENLQDYC